VGYERFWSHDPFRPGWMVMVKRPVKGVCPLCGEYRDESMCNYMYPWPFVKHHWYQPDGSRWKVYICGRCNLMLHSRCSIALGDHLFESWASQTKFVRECLELG